MRYRTDNTVRSVKLNSIDGEFMVVGRQTAETGQVLTTFGQAEQNTVSIQGSGIQEAEFADGFRTSIRASQPMRLNTDVINGVESGMITQQGVQTVSKYTLPHMHHYTARG